VIAHEGSLTPALTKTSIRLYIAATG